jgi:hypothetical protein
MGRRRAGNRLELPKVDCSVLRTLNSNGTEATGNAYKRKMGNLEDLSTNNVPRNF